VAYYGRPTSVDQVTDYVVGRVIDQLGIEHSLINRWKDDQCAVSGSGDRQVLEVDDWTTRIEPTSSWPMATTDRQNGR
jgi:hypothetical protein